jgi:hypothetical protein
VQPHLLSEELSFFIYLLEKYAEYKQISTAEALRLWEQNDTRRFVLDSYEMYHQEALTNAFREIDYHRENGRPLYT